MITKQNLNRAALPPNPDYGKEVGLLPRQHPPSGRGRRLLCAAITLVLLVMAIPCRPLLGRTAAAAAGYYQATLAVLQATIGLGPAIAVDPVDGADETGIAPGTAGDDPEPAATEPPPAEDPPVDAKPPVTPKPPAAAAKPPAAAQPPAATQPSAPAAPPAKDPPPPQQPANPVLTPARFVTGASVVLHEVAQGQGLSVIAKQYGTTVDAIMAGNKLSGDILMIDQPLFVVPGTSTPASVSVTTGPRGPGGAEMLTWPQARWVFNVSKHATIRDLTTGLEFRVKYMGGSNHADCEPLTTADAAVFRQIAGGGNWSWNARPIWVIVDGRPLAASMNTMPHGVQTIYDNGFSGHFCVYFRHSRGHASGTTHAGHQAAVLRAAGLEGVSLPPGM